MAVVRKVFDEAIRKSDVDALLAILNRVDKETRDEVLKAISGVLTNQGKVAALNNVRRVIQVADEDVKGWIVKAIPESYVVGLNHADSELRTLGVDVPSGKVTVDQIKTLEDLAIHKEAVNALISDVYLDFGNGMNGIVRGAEKQLNEALKRQTRAKILTGQLTGQSIDEIRKEIQEVLGTQGFSMLVDRGGRTWTVQRYGEMLARTHIIKSGNEGTLTRAAEFNTDIVQISTHVGACPICTPFEGKLYSISGRSKRFPRLEQFPPYHPNCRHSLLLRPDLS